MEKGQLVVVTDFDGTLMEQDVGATLMKELGVEDRPDVRGKLERFLNKEIGSREWIHTSYGLLGDRQKEVDAIADRMNLRDGAEEFLAYCKNKSIPVTILSDGMKYYIDRIMAANHVTVDSVISNPIQYGEDGAYTLETQNTNPACSWCGCCKSGVVRKLKEEGNRVIYIGDGSSDIYGSSYADWIFARSSLARYLTREEISFYPFATFHDILKVVREREEHFLTGSPERREPAGHSFCKF